MTKPTTVQLQFTRCQIAAFVLVAVLIGIPAAIFGIIAFGRVLFGFGVAIGLPNEAAALAAIMSCMGVGMTVLMAIVHRMCWDKWWWE